MLRQFLKSRKRQRAVGRIRSEFARAGYPLDEFGDSQIEAAMANRNHDMAATISAKGIYLMLKRLNEVDVKHGKASKASNRVLAN